MKYASYASSVGADEPAHPRKIASALTAHTVNLKSVKPDISEFALFATRLQIYVSRLRYMRSSACAHRTVLSAPLFLEQNIKHFVGPDLGPNCLLKIGFRLFGGGGAGSGTANSISRRQRDGVMVHGHVFEIKEADYQTTCYCCFKTRVARGGFCTRKWN